jgi:L,D-transpeptidase ErfK/SrfK
VAPPAAPAEAAEPGASDLLDGEPLRLGLMDPVSRPLLALPPAAVDDVPAAPAGPTAPPPSAAPPADLNPTQAAKRRLVLNRRRKVLSVLEGTRVVRRYPVAVGMPGWETPVGTFSVIEKQANPTWEHPAKGLLLPPGPENPLGSRWIGFHRDCRGRSGFNGQEHLVVKGCVTAGFHGTPNRGSVGRAVSHGCVRLFDEHAKELFDLVRLGTPVIVLP